MRWWRDKRGHGPLRIRHDRRALARVHPISRQLRAARAAMVRRRWKDLLVLAGLYLLICACLLLPSDTDPLWRGFALGVCAGLVLALIAGIAVILDGSLLRRIGRGVESDVGDDLRRVRGVHGVVSSVMFQGCDVDHVVLAPTGIWVLEVKWSMHPASDLDHVWGLPAHLHQTRTAARKVTGLLRSSAAGIPVHPVLVLAGPGMPVLASPVLRDGVLVVNNTSRAEWAALLSTGEPVWHAEGARPAADALVRLRDARVTYERQHAGG